MGAKAREEAEWAVEAGMQFWYFTKRLDEETALPATGAFSSDR